MAELNELDHKVFYSHSVQSQRAVLHQEADTSCVQAECIRLCAIGGVGSKQQCQETLVPPAVLWLTSPHIRASTERGGSELCELGVQK